MMSISTAASRITGFVRTWAMAYALGVTALSASYSVANNIPNMIFELAAGGVLSSVFIPLFIERMQREGEDEAWRFASYVFNIVVVVLGLLAIVGTIWAEPFGERGCCITFVVRQQRGGRRISKRSGRGHLARRDIEPR